MPGFTAQFNIPAGTLADVSAYGGNAPPQTACFALAEVIGLEPLLDKSKQAIAGAFKVEFRFPAELGGYENNVVINLPGRPGVDAEGAKRDKRSLVTTLESLGYSKATIDGYPINAAWFAPDANGPKRMSGVWQPGIPGVKDSYGRFWPVSRESWQSAVDSKRDPASMVPAARAPSGGVSQSEGAAAGAPAPSVGAPAPSAGAPAPSAYTQGAAPPTGMAAFAQ